MALRFDGTAANCLTRSTGLVDYTSAYTWMCWFQNVGDLNTQGVIWGVVDSGFLAFDSVYLGSDGTTINADNETSFFASYTPSANEVVHLALVRASATDIRLYVNGTDVGADTTNDESGRAAVYLEYLGSLITGYPTDARLWAEKVWTAGLSQAEVLSEMQTIRPQRLANLKRFTPFISSTVNAGLINLAGDGTSWTHNGTVSINDAPKGVSWGTTPVVIAENIVYTYARPASDISEGWSLSSGTDSYALLDETSANDSDYIYATAASQTTEVKLQSMSTPKAGTNLSINYRVQGISSGGTVTVSLYCGATLIKADSARTSNGDYTLTVPSTDWDTEVTDWTDMRLRFVSS